MFPKIEAKKRIEKLKKAVNHYRYLYHVLDRQEISDAALDSLKRELSELEQKYPEFISADSPTQRVGGKPLSKFVKSKHKVRQWSFNDAFSEKDILDFDARIKRFLSLEPTVIIDYVCELKIDGFKIVLTYEKGVLKTAATRGDGIIGEDVTQNVKTLESIPLKLEKEVDIVAEGEIWMGGKDFDELNAIRKKTGEAPFANPRNAAAGSIRQLDPSVAASRNLDSFIYDLSWANFELPKTQLEKLELLKKLGLKVNPYFKICRGVDEIVEYWKEWKIKKDKQDYWIDGIAVKLNKTEWREKLGYTGKAPRFAIAFKFPAEQATTVVEDIQVQIGRTGALTPVTHLSPVLVAGSVVSRATLHNEDEIKKLGIKIGDSVIIQKAGDVIPDVIKVLKELRTGNEKSFKMPKKCPICKSDVNREKNSPIIKCPNKQCAVRHRRSLHYFASKNAFNIEGMGPKIIDALLDSGLINDAADIFDLKEGDLISLERFAEKSAKNLVKAIEDRREISLARFITALGILHIGEESARSLADRFGSIENIQKAKLEDLEAVDDIGMIMAKSVYDWFRNEDNKKFLKKLLKYVKIKNVEHRVSNIFKGKVFVLTGSLEAMSRDEAKNKIRLFGGGISGSVSNKTDFVVVGENPGSKYEEAKKLGVKIIDEKKFLNMLK